MLLSNSKMISESEINEMTSRIIGAAMKVHTALGPGLLESAYQNCLLFELHRQNLQAEKEVSFPVIYEDVRIDVGYRIDVLVEDLVVIEVKSVDALAPIHEAQLITYLKLSEKPIGLLINFNVTSLRNGIKRIAGPAFRDISS